KIRIYWNLVLPLSKSALVVVAMFCFMGVWNDFMGPLLYLNTESKYTVSISLQSLRGSYSSKWNLIMAASAIAVLPCVLVFLFGQKHIIGGIAISGIKG
ncbi:MAG: carbohydrate ABC transporter permease, partial [Clostridiales bacterium]|nr:carbohydrate ABC transporter permease [Clostridiales bacterium]